MNNYKQAMLVEILTAIRDAKTLRNIDGVKCAKLMGGKYIAKCLIDELINYVENA